MKLEIFFRDVNIMDGKYQMDFLGAGRLFFLTFSSSKEFVANH